MRELTDVVGLGDGAEVEVVALPERGRPGEDVGLALLEVVLVVGQVDGHAAEAAKRRRRGLAANLERRETHD